MTTQLNNLDKALTIADQTDKVYQDYAGVGNRVFADVRRCHNTTFKNFDITGGGLALTQFAYGFRLGYSGILTDANDGIYFDTVTVKGFGPPSGDYAQFNRDGVDIELGNKNIYFKNFTGDGATDGVVDSKVSWAAQDSKFRDSMKLIRVWPGVTVLLENCTLELTHPENFFFWFQDNTGKVLAHNCKFLLNGAPVDPKLYITCDNQPADKSMLQIVDTNPLPVIPFFFPAASPPAGQGWVQSPLHSSLWRLDMGAGNYLIWSNGQTSAISTQTPWPW